LARPIRSPASRIRSLRGGRLALALALILGALLVVLRIAASIYVNVLWSRSVGYEDVFWRRLAWSWGTQAVVGVLVSIFLFLNLRLVVGTLGAIQIKRRFGDLEIAEQLPKSYVLWAAAGLAALVGLWSGAAIQESIGIQALVALGAPAFGVRDPIFARDLSFYVFTLPLVNSGITFFAIVLGLVFTVCLGGYAATGALRWGRGSLVMSEQPRVHLGALVAGFLCLWAVRLWIRRYLLLMDGTSEVQGIFGYADAEARLPALQVMSAMTLVAAGAVFWGVWRNRAVPVVGGLVAVIAGGILGVQFYPSLVQRFRVEPNELTREAPYIEMNMRFTRLAFGLDELKRSLYRYAPPPGADWEGVARQMEGLPVWAGDPLLTAYQQLEARFQYYDFSAVVVDRYPTPEGPKMVALAVREIEPSEIEEPNWQNLHLRERFVSGMGAVASDATDRTQQGQPIMFLSGLPPEFQPGTGAPEALRLVRSSVYFGARDQTYAILNPGPTSFLAPDSTPGVPGVDYPEGVPLTSPLRTLSFAWELGETNLLFASEVSSSSRMVIRRQVSGRATEIFPYLRYPEPPQPVIHEGRLVWLLDGFTSTRYMPLARVYDLEGRPVAYARNSVRVLVDAVTGDVTFYRMPGGDPMLEAYDRAFPGLFRPFDELPVGLRDHLRYSRRLLDLQAQVLLQYHQEAPQQFHAQQDVWGIPTELAQGTNPVPYRPEYGVWTLPEETEETFVLSTVFVPAARQNLTAVLAGRVARDGNPELFLYDVPVEDQAPGPRQIEAMVEQDPAISQQFSLWRNSGSRVWTGHLHLVPQEGHILYMESVFLASEADAIPELRRFVVSDGERVVMEPTLQESLAAFSGSRSAPRPSLADLPTPGPGEQWPARALQLLEGAQRRLREGDWSGFGSALEELKELLEEANLPSAAAR
jgi:uncharacterized membrane protein (UPF0182 family)